MRAERRRAGRRIRRQRRRDRRALYDAVTSGSLNATMVRLADAVAAGIATMTEAIAAGVAQLISWANANACPPCQDGNHDACVDRSWSVELDMPVACSCSLACHRVTP